jgi:hypothetical protein
MRRSNRVRHLGMAALAALLAAGCAGNAVPPVPDAPSAGEEAINDDRGLTDGDRGVAGSNTGTWGGVQMPDVQSAPRLPLPPSRVPGL